MEESEVSRRHQRFTLVLFGLAYAARLVGAAWGLPLLFHPDEPFVADHALVMVRTGDPNPHWFLYPDLWIYVHAAIVKIVETLIAPCEGFYAEGRCVQANVGLALVYLTGRALTAFLGGMTALVIYRAAKQLWGPGPALVAAAWVALDPSHVRHSQFITTDVASGFFSSLVLLLAIEGRMLTAGAFAGLAAATKYNAGLSVLLPLALSLHRGLGARRMAATLGASALTFVIVMPWVLLDTRSVLADLAEQARHYAAGHFGADSFSPWWFYLDHFFRDAPGLFLVAAAGWLGLICREPRLAMALLSFPFCYYLLFCSVRITVARNMMPIVPLLAMAAGYAYLVALESKWLRRPAPWILAAALLPAVGSIARTTYAVRAPDPRSVSLEWMSANLSPAAKLVGEFYGPPLMPPRFKAVPVTSLSRNTLEEYTKNEVDYLVASSGTYGRYLDDPEREPHVTRFYRRLFAEWPEVASFEPAVPDQGPVVRIFGRPGRTVTEGAGSSPSPPGK